MDCLSCGCRKCNRSIRLEIPRSDNKKYVFPVLQVVSMWNAGLTLQHFLNRSKPGSTKSWHYHQLLARWTRTLVFRTMIYIKFKILYKLASFASYNYLCVSLVGCAGMLILKCSCYIMLSLLHLESQVMKQHLGLLFYTLM